MALSQSKKKDQEVQNFASRLGEAIELRGIRKSALAEAAQVDPGYISKLLSGERENPRGHVLRAIADKLEVKTHWLLTGEPPRDLTEAEKRIAQVRLQNPDGSHLPPPPDQAMPPLASGRRRSAKSSTLEAAPSTGLEESPVHYGASAEAERLQREIMQRLDDESLSSDELAQEALHRRVDEYIKARRAKLK